MFPGVARNNEGFREINEFLTDHNLNNKAFTYQAPDFENVFVIYPFRRKRLTNLKENELIGIKPNEVLKLFSTDNPDDKSKLVVFQPVTFADRRHIKFTKISGQLIIIFC